MLRKIISIDRDKCNGCGLCVQACHESAIGMVDHKAKLLRVDYCDGLGNCLPVCPTGAISFIETEADSAVEVRQWPIQIQLVPVSAPYFENAHLLVAADCTAYAYSHFHSDFVTGKTVIIGCPKLDTVDYSKKLAEIFLSNNIISVTVVRMEVPCCGGMEFAVKTALENSGKKAPLSVVTVSIEGTIL